MAQKALPEQEEIRRLQAERMRRRWADPEERRRLSDKLRRARPNVRAANLARRRELEDRQRQGHLSVLNRWLDAPSPDVDLRRVKGKIRKLRGLTRTGGDALTLQRIESRYQAFKAQVEHLRAEG